MGCCQGSCEAEANLTCQIDCQASGYVDCKASLQGGCEASCETEEGALFCDGQYVDHGGNLADCVNALKELFNIEVSGYAEGSCSGGSCMGEAGGALSCSSSVHPFDGRGPLALGFLVGLAMLGSGRRRRA
jgi:MYXO-CTERM domain-containing protein